MNSEPARRKHGSPSPTRSPVPPKHKHVRSYNIPGDAHALTFSCFHGLELLSKDRSRQWFISAMRCARRDLKLSIWAYVIMPEHVHIILWPQQPEYQISTIRTALKVPVQRKALRFLRCQAPHFLDRLKDVQPNGQVHYRFWQRGGGYDRNVIEPATLTSMIEYLHNNPVRRGLVAKPTDWYWSSARFYAGIKPVPIEMDPLPGLLDG
jgi:putative transposase